MEEQESRKRVRVLPKVLLGAFVLIVIFVIVIWLSLLPTKLIGKWENDEGWMYEFRDDGTGSYSLSGIGNIDFFYEKQGDIIVLKYGENDEVKAKCHIEGRQLVVKGETGEMVYRKK